MNATIHFWVESSPILQCRRCILPVVTIGRGLGENLKALGGQREPKPGIELPSNRQFDSAESAAPIKADKVGVKLELRQDAHGDGLNNAGWTYSPRGSAGRHCPIR
jgi:hypothetical protein